MEAVSVVTQWLQEREHGDGVGISSQTNVVRLVSIPISTGTTVSWLLITILRGQSNNNGGSECVVT